MKLAKCCIFGLLLFGACGGASDFAAQLLDDEESDAEYIDLTQIEQALTSQRMHSCAKTRAGVSSPSVSSSAAYTCE